MPDYAQGEMPRDKTRHLRVIYASMWCIQVHISFSISFLESRHNFHSDKIFMQVCDAFRSIFNFPTLSYFFGITSDKIYMKVYVKCLDQKKTKVHLLKMTSWQFGKCSLIFSNKYFKCFVALNLESGNLKIYNLSIFSKQSSKNRSCCR